MSLPFNIVQNFNYWIVCVGLKQIWQGGGNVN